MTGSVPAELVALANSLADAARPIAARYFRTPVTVDDKSDLSPVTIADREAETAMRALLAKHVPSHGIFGEEHGASAPTPNTSGCSIRSTAPRPSSPACRSSAP